MTEGSAPLRSAIVGCGRMAKGHARVMAGLDEYELTAACDLDEARAREFAEEFDIPNVCTDIDEMMSTLKPDVVSIATAADSHAALTIRAAAGKPRAICTEKPMAVNLGEARRMVEACGEAGAVLVINHQRRMGADFLEMRRLIEPGAIGDVSLLRGLNAGAFLSDGTHTIDCIRWLMGDADVKWVLGQVYRDAPDESEEKSGGYTASGGWRYGHPIETGAFAVFEFESGVRAEILCGRLMMPPRVYQDHEVFGDKGRLWRRGDSADPAILIQDNTAGGWRDASGIGAGEVAPESQAPRNAMTASYQAMARSVHEGTPHPMSGESALAGFEVLMAVYESARLNKRIELPLQQDEFPLKLMIDEGRL